MYKLVIALRYLARRRITFFPIAGVAVAVMTSVVVMAMIDGFEKEFARRMRLSTPDAVLYFQLRHGGYDAGSREGLEAFLRRIEAVPGVAAASPVVFTGGRETVRMPIPGTDQYVVRSLSASFVGVDFVRESKVTDLHSTFRNGGRSLAPNPKDPRPRVVVGARLLGRRSQTAGPGKDWGLLGADMPIQLVSVDRLSAKTLSAVIGDIYKTDLYMDDREMVLVPIDALRKLLGLPPYSVLSVNVRFKDSGAAASKAGVEHIREALGGIIDPKKIMAWTWQEQFSRMADDLEIARHVMRVILLLLTVLAGFVIAAVLAMTVLSKIRDIGVLRAMGASARGIAKTYVFYGAAAGIAGAALGMLAAVIVLHKIELVEKTFYGVTGWSRPVDMELTFVPWVLTWPTVAQCIVGGIAVSIAASILPAFRGARLDPVKAINR